MSPTPRPCYCGVQRWPPSISTPSFMARVQVSVGAVAYLLLKHVSFYWLAHVFQLHFDCFINWMTVRCKGVKLGLYSTFWGAQMFVSLNQFPPHPNACWPVDCVCSGSELRITVSGNAAEQQLSDLEGSTTYTVTITSQLGGLESSPTTTSFTTTSGQHTHPHTQWWYHDFKAVLNLEEEVLFLPV